MEYSVKVERDLAPDADDHGGWKVVKHQRGPQGAGWIVVFRGDPAECDDYARDLADDLRTFVREAE